MAHEERRLLVRPVLGRVVLDAVAEKQVARQTEHPAQLLLVRDSREQGDRAALRESAEHDSRRADALVDLFLDQGVEVVAGAEDTGLVLVAKGFFKVQLYIGLD